MGSPGKKASRSSSIIVVDGHSYRSTSSNSYNTMSSRGSYSGLRTGSDPYTPTSSSTNVVHEQVRSTKAEDYKADIYHRGSKDRNVSVINHYGSGYEDNAPHPTYYTGSSRKDNPRK